MPTATEAPEKVTVVCEEPGCDRGPTGGPWRATVKPDKQVQVMAMHRARHHGYRTTHATSLRQAEVRTGHAEPRLANNRYLKVQEQVAENVRTGVYKPGRKLVLSELAREFDLGTNSMRQILYRLNRTARPLVRQKDGAFYVTDKAEAGEVAERAAPSQPAKKTRKEQITDQLRSELGTKYPLGSALPVGFRLGETFEISDNTTNRAIRTLREEGLVDKNRIVIALPPTAAETPKPEPVSSPGPEPAPIPIPPERAPEPKPETLPSTDPLASALSFLTRLADLGATAELQRLWALEASGFSPEDQAKMQAEIDKLRTELIVAQGENRNLTSGIHALREEKATSQQEFKTLKQSYVRLQSAHQEILDEYRHHLSVAQLVGAPTNGPTSKLSVEAAMSERKPLPHRRSY